MNGDFLKYQLATIEYLLGANPPILHLRPDESVHLRRPLRRAQDRLRQAQGERRTRSGARRALLAIHAELLLAIRGELLQTVRGEPVEP